MGREFSSLFQLETKRLLWIMGITFAVVLAFQYLELPYGNVILSLFSAKILPTSGSATRFQATNPLHESQIVNNVTTIFNQANSTSDEDALEKANETRRVSGFVSEPGMPANKSIGFDEFGKSSMVDSTNRSANVSNSHNITMGLSFSTNGSREAYIASRPEHQDAYSPSPSPEKAPTYLTQPFSPTTNVSPNITTAMLSNDYNVSISQKDNNHNITSSINKESFRPSQNGGNIQGKNSSSISTVPKEGQDIPHTPIPEVTSVSEMNKLLLQSHASYRSMVCDRSVKFQLYYDDDSEIVAF